MKSSGKSKKFKLRITDRSKKILTIVLAVAVVILIVMTAAQKLGNMTVSTFTADVKTYFMSLGSGDGYPYEISAGNFADLIGKGDYAEKPHIFKPGDEKQRLKNDCF